MKTVFRPMLFIFLLMLLTASCNKQEIFLEDLISGVVEDETTEDSEDATIYTSLVCDFDLSTASAGDTIIINCIMDLNGQSINIPADVSIIFEGGDIINGTLNFGDGGIIDGRLLNHTLTITGSTPQIKDPTFNFDPTRWGIIEYEVTQEEAATNNLVINDLLIQAQALGATTFKIDKLDAYFYGNVRYQGGIEIPSNMNFKMTENTHLRQFVTASFRSLIYLHEVENINVSGGYLHGPRNIAGFDPYVGGGNLIVVSTGDNVTFENIHLSNSAQDGMNLESNGLAYQPYYIPSKNITVRGCTFDSNRRNNLSITDGMDYLIENCTFLNAGINMEHSDGLAPRFGIDLEPEVHDADNPWQRLERVVIRNCTESGSAQGGIVFADGDDYVFDGNTFETGVFMAGASNVKITNNNLKEGINIGIEPGWYGRLHNKNTIVSGNTITGKGDGKGVGISATNQDVKIFNNHIINCGVGIQLNSLKDSHVYNNTIESIGANDDGINAIFYLDNVLIENNAITVKDFLWYFDYVNADAPYKDFKFTVKNNTFTCTGDRFGFTSNTTGIDFIGNTINGGAASFGNCKNVLFKENTVTRNAVNFWLSGADLDNYKIINNNFSGPLVGTTTSTTLSDKNIEISNNKLKGKDWDEAVYISGYNGVIMKDNSGSSEKSPLIIYNGNNSVFTNNINTNVAAPLNRIQGSNNIIN
jgi:hypothetical protein